VAHQVGQPREEQVWLVADLAAEPAAVLGLDSLEPSARNASASSGDITRTGK
jgi:hypothetical protein